MHEECVCNTPTRRYYEIIIHMYWNIPVLWTRSKGFMCILVCDVLRYTFSKWAAFVIYTNDTHEQQKGSVRLHVFFSRRVISYERKYDMIGEHFFRFVIIDEILISVFIHVFTGYNYYTFKRVQISRIFGAFLHIFDKNKNKNISSSIFGADADWKYF